MGANEDKQAGASEEVLRRGALRALLVPLLLIAVGAPAFAYVGGWEQVFANAPRRPRLICVMAARGREWIAGGIGAIVEGNAERSKVQALDGLAVEALGVGPDGATYAVGSYGTIWRRGTDSSWQIEHQSRPVGSKAKRRYQDLLVGIRKVYVDGKTELVAHGPGGSSLLIRSAQGTWAPPPDAAIAQQLSAYAVEGPSLSIPANCEREVWRWIDDHDGLAVCRDGRAIGLLNGKTVPLGKLPRECEFMTDVVRRGSELFACCGRGGHIYAYADDAWTRVPGIAGIFSLAANDPCLVAASDRAIWQQCK